MAFIVIRYSVILINKQDMPHV